MSAYSTPGTLPTANGFAPFISPAPSIEPDHEPDDDHCEPQHIGDILAKLLPQLLARHDRAAVRNQRRRQLDD